MIIGLLFLIMFYIVVLLSLGILNFLIFIDGLGVLMSNFVCSYILYNGSTRYMSIESFESYYRWVWRES